MQERIRQLMEAQHMNQQAFARFTNIGVASLSSIFTGRTRPTMNHLIAIMDAFPNVNPTWLIKGEGEMMLSDIGSNGSVQGASAKPADVQGSFQGGDADQSVPGLQTEVGVTGSVGDTTRDNVSVENSADNMSVSRPHNTSGNGRGQRAVCQVGAVHSPGYTAVQPIASARKITEIRVFYDDQTWESFVPKK